jgi:predicted ATPase with chaperone activity
VVRERVLRARARQLGRKQEGQTANATNATLTSRELSQVAALDADGKRLGR